VFSTSSRDPWSHGSRPCLHRPRSSGRLSPAAPETVALVAFLPDT